MTIGQLIGGWFTVSLLAALLVLLATGLRRRI
jgi:hypothetical protein